MEMIRLLSGLTEKYYPRHYVVAKSDKFSDTKIEEFEQRRSLCAGGDKAVSYIFFFMLHCCCSNNSFGCS